MSIYSFGNVEMQAYRSICTAIQNYSTHAKIPVISMENALSIYKKALSESKQGYMYNQNQIRMSNGIFGCELKFDLCDEFSNGRIQTDIRVIPEIAEIMNLARKEKTVYEAIKTVYAYFVQKFEYAYDCADDIKYHSALSVFMYRKSVCEGFALALSNVLNCLGISCGIITGYSSLNGVQGTHAWNIVEFDKSYYHLDVTWDICTKDKGSKIFDYFFLDDRLVQQDHRWNDTNIPYATDNTRELYANSGLCCSNEQECVRIILSGLKQKKTNIAFRFISDRGCVNFTFEDAKRYFEIAVNQGNFVYCSVSFFVNSACGTVCFSVKYGI